jgi:hypothetical protein
VRDEFHWLDASQARRAVRHFWQKAHHCADGLAGYSQSSGTHLLKGD